MEKYIEDKYGAKRLMQLMVCKNCNKEFWARKDFVLQGRYDCCCRKCSCIYNNRDRRVECICDFCGKEFYRALNKLKVSRSGLRFCSRICKDTAQKLENGFVDMHPDHYGKAKIGPYRRMAFDKYEHKCVCCGWNKDERILEVHHRDRNRLNNNIENLVILCSICHSGLNWGFYRLTEENKLIDVESGKQMIF